jgi:hypothetical protein
MLVEQLGSRGADRGKLVPVRRLDQQLPGREVPVQRADADAGVLGDPLQRRLETALRERGGRGGQDLVAVALGVRAQRALGGARHLPLLERVFRP